MNFFGLYQNTLDSWTYSDTLPSSGCLIRYIALCYAPVPKTVDMVVFGIVLNDVQRVAGGLHSKLGAVNQKQVDVARTHGLIFWSFASLALPTPAFTVSSSVVKELPRQIILLRDAI